MGEGPVVCVDFDKTLTDPDQDEWRPAFEQEPRPEVIEAVQEAYKSGKKIIIWTARQWNEAPEVAGWLTAHEVPHHGVQCGKGGAEKYVDDKAISPEKFIREQSDEEPIGFLTSADTVELQVSNERKSMPLTDASVEWSGISTVGEPTPSIPDYISQSGTRNY
jgi:hydroxymethylpyrimidine pyrophosphatase-like HAD family hydrolase